MNGSVRPSARLSVRHTFLTMFPSLYHHEIFMMLLPATEVTCMQKVKVRGQRSSSQRSQTQFNRFQTVTPV